MISGATLGGYNLGDHNVTQNLNLRSFQLVGNEGTLGISIAQKGTATAKGINVRDIINLRTNYLIGEGLFWDCNH